MIQKLTWKEFYCLFDRLLDHIEFAIGGKFQKVVGIANGGINISIPIANKLKLPHQSVLIHRDTSYIENINFVHDSLPFILIDDICDSGKTIEIFSNHFESCCYIIKSFFCCYFCKLRI